MAAPARKRVVIVGAGLAGLTAANRVKDAAPDAEVLLLESSDRVGGRTSSTRSAVDPRVTVDIGGQWLGARQDAALALAARLGVPLQPQFCTGRRVLQIGLDVRSYTGLIPNIGIGQLIDAQFAILLLKLMQLFIWCGCLLRWADRTTMEHLSTSVMCTQGGRALLRIVVQALFGAEPSQVSVLAFCRYINASDTIEHMSEIGPGSLQCWTMRGGAQQLSIALAREAVSKGVRLLFNHQVASVRRGHACADASCTHGDAADAEATAATAAAGRAPVLITCTNGTAFTADHVVMAAPAPIVNERITFSPPLSPARTALMSTATMGCIIKSIVVYDRAWWRAAGYSGEVICDTTSDPEGGPAFNIFDGCTPVGSLPTAAAAAATAGSGTDGASFAPGVPSAHFINDGSDETDAAGAGAAAGGAVTTAASTGAGAIDATVLQRRIEYVSGTHPVTGAKEQLLPVLVVFINGAKAAEWSRTEPAVRRKAVLRQLARWFGDARALQPLEYIEQVRRTLPGPGCKSPSCARWVEAVVVPDLVCCGGCCPQLQDWVAYPHTHGCPIATYGQGVLEQFGLARHLGAPDWLEGSASGAPAEPVAPYGGATAVVPTGNGAAPRVHRLHFCGTETSPVGTGFMDGAIRSGERVAAEVVASWVAASNPLRGGQPQHWHFAAAPPAAATTEPAATGGSKHQPLAAPLLTV